MKNRIFNCIILVVALMLLATCSDKGDKLVKQGNIYGVVSDKATGEPVSSAGVSLNPTGAKTINRERRAV
ncbi:MAG: hypothetical protein LBM07_07870 [Culturomica sp.]|jgi:hypothetical protein|nr:hypothetical protein [Culturomica sp.]